MYGGPIVSNTTTTPEGNNITEDITSKEMLSV